jgi:tRNA pseudouridine38-40 synthase
LLRFGYDGAAFHGWARQPGLRTIEGEILNGLARRGVAASTTGPRLEVASRTDRAVSARRNALALSSSLDASALLRVLNGVSAEIFFTAASEVPDQFPVRRATRRVYRYFEPSPPTDRVRWERGAACFAGRVDVRSFGRGLPLASPQWRTLESVRLSAVRNQSVIEVRAPSFVWGMVRKIVGALRAVDRGQLTVERLSRALAGQERLTLPLAEPEPLVLWEVEFPLKWQYHWTGPNRHQVRAWDRALTGSRSRQRVLESVSRGWTPRGP